MIHEEITEWIGREIRSAENYVEKIGEKEAGLEDELRKVGEEKGLYVKKIEVFNQALKVLEAHYGKTSGVDTAEDK